MFRIGLQFFAHKKGVGSTKVGATASQTGWVKEG